MQHRFGVQNDALNVRDPREQPVFQAAYRLFDALQWRVIVEAAMHRCLSSGHRSTDPDVVDVNEVRGCAASASGNAWWTRWLTSRDASCTRWTGILRATLACTSMKMVLPAGRTLTRSTCTILSMMSFNGRVRAGTAKR
jgi:hypothetical protein